MADGGKGRGAVDRAERDDLSPEQVTVLAERSVLATGLLDPQAAPLLGTMVRASDFSDPRHAVVFESMQRVLAMGAPLDVVTLAADLRARERLNTVGGAQFLGELTDEIPSTGHVEAHARLVRESAARRRTADAARVVAALCAGGASMAEIEAKVAEMSAATVTAEDEGFCTLGEAGDDVITNLERLSTPGARLPGVTTGFRCLDRRIGRFRPGQLVVVGGRPAMGKSALTEVMAIHAAVEELASSIAQKRPARPVLFFSLEMPRMELAARAMAFLKQIDLARIIHGRLTQDELTRVFACTKDLARLPFKILAGPVSFRRIRSLCLREKAKSGGVNAVYIDYAQIIVTEERTDQNRERELAEMSRGLKLLAGDKQLDCPIVLDAQLNRELEKRKDKRPILADLRESGAFEQDADVVLFVYRDEVYNPESEHRGRAEVLVAKQRNGPPGKDLVGFNGAMTTFYELERAVDDEEGGYDPEPEAPAFEGEGLPDMELAGLPLASAVRSTKRDDDERGPQWTE